LMALTSSIQVILSRHLWVAILVLAAFCSLDLRAADKAPNDSSTFTAFEKNGKYGFKDSSGNVVIPAQFDDVAEKFSEGVCVAKASGRYGFINERGQFVIEPRYASALSFHEGAARVLVATDGNFRFIDHHGDWLFHRTFDATGIRFSEGLLPVKNGAKWGFVDRTGKEVIRADYYFAQPFSEGLAAVQVPDEFGTWGYINWKGEWAIRPRFTAASPFQNGKASVSILETKRQVIDRRGRVIE